MKTIKKQEFKINVTYQDKTGNENTSSVVVRANNENDAIDKAHTKMSKKIMKIMGGNVEQQSI